MDECQWVSCDQPDTMALFLENKTTRRKWWLAGCAFFRCHWVGLKKQVRRAVEMAEGHADNPLFVENPYSGTVANSEFLEAWEAISMDEEAPACWDALALNRPFLFCMLSLDAGLQRAGDCQSNERKCEEQKQSDILRDIFGPLPFRSIQLEAGWLSWNNSTVSSLAQVIYDERAFGNLPILADALEDAGCHIVEVLEHCRSDRDHVLGCWVVDLVLGKH